MTRFGWKTPVMTRPAPAALAVGLAAVLMAPVPGFAFFQQTKLEGMVGADVGGTWLSMQYVMPEFRITFPTPKDGSAAVPVKVGPVPPEFEPMTGKNPTGVAITDCGTSGFCSDNGLIVGDIVIKVNTTAITDVASFEKALENLPPSVLLSVRRPSLRMTTARLLKIRYAREGRETDEGSVEQEKLDLKVLDVKLPFADAVEKTRESHEFFVPTAAELEALGKTWTDLPANQPLVLFRGDHRFVAKSSFDQALADDVALKNSTHGLVMDMDGNPLSGGGKVIDLYGIESMGKGVLEGNYVTVTIASAPFPINIEFKGRFKMTRIGDWSDEDEKKREAADAKKAPPEDLSKYKTLPDVPPPAGKK
jgi:hypothetical protein